MKRFLVPVGIVPLAWLAFAFSEGAEPTNTAAGSLIFSSDSSERSRSITLRRDGPRLVIVDDRTEQVLATAAAAVTRSVVVRGAPGDHDDTLRIDLSEPFSLAGGIEYDGGARGWDTLVLAGGSARRQVVSQLSPHDGIVELDELVVRYSNLEPLSDVIAAATLTIVGTAGADTMTLADGPGAGEATLSSPTFESYTFSNKTNVVIDGLGGGDSLVFANPTPSAGLFSLVVTNVGAVSQTAPFAYPVLGVSSDGPIALTNAANDVIDFEASTVSGSITFVDANQLRIGGVAASLPGVSAGGSGTVSVTASNGSIVLADTDGPAMVMSGPTGGNVSLVAQGASSDVTATANNDAISAPMGFISVNAGRDILFGTSGANLDNDVRANGSITFIAGRDITIDGNADVSSDDFGNNTGGTASAQATGNFTLAITNGADASFGASGGAGADAEVTAGGAVTLLAPTSAALFSSSGSVLVRTDRLIVAALSGILTSGDLVRIVTNTASHPVDLGSATDVAAALEISDVEIDRITAPTLIVEAQAGAIDMTQAISRASGTLVLVGAGTFGASGLGSLSAPDLSFEDSGSSARAWTIDASDVTVGGGASIPYSAVATLSALGGSAADSFTVTPSATTAISIEGNDPAPPASPGDTLTVDLTGTTSASLSSTSTPAGFQGNFTFGNRMQVDFAEIETIVAPVDLQITKTDGQTQVDPGDLVAYTIEVTNPAGGLDLTGVTVTDLFPAELTGVTFTCSATPGSTCTANGTGNISDVVTVAAGGTLTYQATGTLDLGATGTLVNTASVTLPMGFSDPNEANNSATDSDTITEVAVPSEIPTLSATMLGLFAVALGLAGWLGLGRRPGW